MNSNESGKDRRAAQAVPDEAGPLIGCWTS